MSKVTPSMRGLLSRDSRELFSVTSGYVLDSVTSGVKRVLVNLGIDMEG